MWKPTHVDVTVIKAKDLIVKGKGSNDVYSIIQLSKEKFQTTTREKTTNPEWNEECSFEIPSDMSKSIEITLYHRNLLSIDRFLGRIALPIDELFSFQEKPHAQWYALRAKTTKKKAKYRGEILVRTTFVFRSDALGSAAVGSAQSGVAGKGSTLTPLGSEFLRKSATNLPMSLINKNKGSFREKGSAPADDKRTSTTLASEDGTSRQRLNRSHSLAALTMALRRGSVTKKGSSKDDVSEANRRRRESDDDDDDDQSESVASRTRVETDEERDDFSTNHAHALDDSAVIQRKQYSLPHTVGSASHQALTTPGGGISRAVSSVSAGTPQADRFMEREGSGRLKASTKGANQHNSNDSQVSGTGGPGIQRQPSARSSASESGLSIDARSQSSGLGFHVNGTPPKSSTIQQITNSNVNGGNNSHLISRGGSVNSAPNTANTPNPGRFPTSTITTPSMNPPKGGSLRLHNENTILSHNNNSTSNNSNNNNNNSGSGVGSGGGGGGIPLPSFSPRTSTTVIPSEVYAQYGRMSREELLQVIARQQIEISRRDDYIDEMLSRVMEKAHWILQKS